MISYASADKLLKMKEKIVDRIQYMLLFKFDRKDIEPSDYERLNEIGTILAANPDRTVKVGGHSDSIGPKRYNLRLSEKRAANVRKALVQYGASDTQIEAKGYGIEAPAASNETSHGRMLNRRVEIIENE